MTCIVNHYNIANAAVSRRACNLGELAAKAAKLRWSAALHRLFHMAPEVGARNTTHQLISLTT